VTTTHTLKNENIVKELFFKAFEGGQQTLSEYQSKRIIETVGVPVMKAVGLKSIYADIR
jgi:hypothetical protein